MTDYLRKNKLNICWILLIAGIASMPSMTDAYAFEAKAKLLLMLVNLVTVATAYLCFDRMFDDSWIGLAGSLMYAWCPYRCKDLYVQGDWSEGIAWIFFPLIMLGLTQLYRDAREMKKTSRAWITLAVGFGFLAAFSHTLFFVALGSTVLLFLAMGRRSFCRTVLVCVGKTILATALVSAWVLVPLMLRMSDASVVGPLIPVNFRMEGMYLIQYLSFFSMEQMGPGMIPVVFGFVYLWSLFVGKIPKDGSRRVLCVVGILVLLSTNSFPWDLMQNKNMLFSIVLALLQSPAKWGVAACGGLLWIACYMLSKLPLRETFQRLDTLKMNWAKSKFVTVFWLAVLAVFASLPVLVDYLIVGTKLTEHLAKITALVNQFGIGSGLVYRILVVVIQFVTAGVAYVSFSKSLKSGGQALLGVLIYMLAPARIFLLYSVADITGGMILAVLPLAVWVVCHICKGAMKGKEKIFVPIFITLTAFCAGYECLWQDIYSVAATLLACVFYGIGCYWQSVKGESKGNVAFISAAVVATVYGTYLLNGILMNGWEILR